MYKRDNMYKKISILEKKYLQTKQGSTVTRKDFSGGSV